MSVLTIAAGPVYVEFRTKTTSPPSSNTHSELVPPEGKWKPQIGGSVWKLATHHQRHRQGDKFVLISRFAKENRGDLEPMPPAPFTDDAWWLKQSIRTESGITGDKHRLSSESLDVVFKPASRDALTDYTFHMEHPVWRPWPVLTIQGGAAREIIWQDVVVEWKKNWLHCRSDYEDTIVFLTGVLRTQLLDTLALAITDKDESTLDLLAQAKVVIDFGRTNVNLVGKGPGTQAGGEFAAWRNKVVTCVQYADVVLADEHTADTFGLLQPENLPKYRLVIRRATQDNEMWWQYCRASSPKKVGRNARTMHAFFTVPTSDKSKAAKGGRRDRVNRPARDYTVARSLCLRQTTFQPRTWFQFVDPNCPRTVEDITASADFRSHLFYLERLIQLEAIDTLFMYGETGTGKEIIARWIHANHPAYANGKFHAVSCGRQRGDLVQSELFGHVKGAFSEASRDRDGTFATANGGVLLLDDLDSLDELTQAMLLQVIENGLVLPLGGDAERPVRLFLVVTTNVHPDELIRRGTESAVREYAPSLREDLYFRFRRSGETLYLPPLRERREDIYLVAKRMWAAHNRQFAVNFEFPKLLTRALKKSDLVGNFQTLDAAVATTFRTTLTLCDREDAIPQGEIRLPEIVSEWLSETAEKEKKDSTAGTDVDQGSRFLAWLDQQGQRKRFQMNSLDENVKELVRLWLVARDQDREIEESLTLSQIKQCLGNNEGNRLDTRLRKALSAARVLPQGTGRRAKWKLE